MLLFAISILDPPHLLLFVAFVVVIFRVDAIVVVFCFLFTSTISLFLIYKYISSLVVLVKVLQGNLQFATIMGFPKIVPNGIF